MLAACANQKEPAEKAVAQVESSLAEFRADAEKYAAGRAQAVDASVQPLKENLAQARITSEVVTGAPVGGLRGHRAQGTVAKAKADSGSHHGRGPGGMDRTQRQACRHMVEELQARVDQLAKTRKLPKGVDKAGFEAIKTNFESLKTDWTEAGSEFASGQAADAVRKARGAKAKAEELINTLEVQV